MPRPLRAEVLDKIHGAHMGESQRLSFAPGPVLLASTLITVSLLLSKYANTGALVMTDFSLSKAFFVRRRRNLPERADFIRVRFQSFGREHMFNVAHLRNSPLSLD